MKGLLADGTGAFASDESFVYIAKTLFNFNASVEAGILFLVI